MIDIKIQYLKCNRCGHEWIPRSPNYPKVCAKCNSPYWNKKRSMNMKKKITKEDKEWIEEKTEMAYYAPDKRKK